MNTIIRIVCCSFIGMVLQTYTTIPVPLGAILSGCLLLLFASAGRD